MAPLRVVVTGAGGRTGIMVLKKMAAQPQLFAVSGAARTEASAQAIKRETGAECAACDVTDPVRVAAVLDGVETLVILSSATPKLSKLKMVGVLARKFCLCDKSARIGEAFQYTADGFPERVDWEGQRNLIDAAKQAGVKHVIVVGSMGGTQPEHFLNKMGNGNILLWKRKAEKYLIKSGLAYTIIHPGGLLPHWGTKDVPGGQRELVVGVDDELMSRKSRCIPRMDVAEVVLQCAITPEAIGRAFDICSNDPEPNLNNQVWDGSVKTLLEKLGGKNCDYASPSHEILGDS